MRSLLLSLLSLLLFCPFCRSDAARADTNTIPTHPTSIDQPTSIVGGSLVPRGRWPDVVAVLGHEGTCTGTLVAPDVVLTAGHCIGARPYEVIVDTIDYTQPSTIAGGERIRVTWSRAYPNWETRYDIGVLLLEHAATYAKPRVVTSACTARALVVPNTAVEIVGFGLSSPDALDNNTRLRQATVPITDPTCTLDPACNPVIAPNGEFMAGGHGADSCFGDSGGPVYIDTKDGHGHALLAVVSRGRALPAAPCGDGGVYVRVDKVISWVQSLTGRKLTRTSCASSSGDESESDADPDASSDGTSLSTNSGGCSTGSAVGLVAALALLLCAWLLARKDRMLDARDFDP
jgi:secreted trypsin-like serine protease